MKKLKSILLLLLSCLFVAVFAFAGCSSSGSDDSGSDSTSTSDSTGGDSTSGDSTGGDSTGGDSTGGDSSSEKPTYDTVPLFANMDVVYTGDTQYTYEGKDITIDLSPSLITATSHIGNDSTDLYTETVTDYTLKYSIDSSAFTEVEGTSFTATCRGTYSIYAIAEYYYSEDEEPVEMSGFFIVYVIDAPTAFAYNSDGTTSYEAKPEESDIGTDWTYTLTLASGATETLSYDDVTFEPSTSAGDNTVTVTYVDEYTCLVDGVVTTVTNTYTADVAYTVAGEVIATNVVLNISDLVTDGTLSVDTYSSETKLFNDNATTISVTASSTSTVSVDANGKSIDGYEFTHRLKLGGAGSADARSVKVVTAGACTITVYAMSSSSGSTRTLALYDSSYSSLDATQSDDGKAIAKYTYTISAAGTYYIASTSGGMNVYGILVTY